MKFIPKLISKKKNFPDRFVVLDIGLGRVNVAIFDNTAEGPKFVGVGRRSFNSFDTILDATLEATDALGAIVDDLPRAAIVGVCGGKLETVTRTARYKREKPQKPIDGDEIARALEKLVEMEDQKDLRVFFSTVSSATIDDAKVTNPIGVKGEQAEITCFIAFKPERELAVYDQIIDELDIKPERILPTSYAVAKMFTTKQKDNALLVRVGLHKTETAQIHDGHLVRVGNFDVGSEQLGFFQTGVEVVLSQQDKKELPKTIWLYADSDEVELDKTSEAIDKIDWKGSKNLKPKIELASSEENFGEADMGLLALSLEEIK